MGVDIGVGSFDVSDAVRRAAFAADDIFGAQDASGHGLVVRNAMMMS
jgi:hypothetical protein